MHCIGRYLCPAARTSPVEYAIPSVGSTHLFSLRCTRHYHLIKMPWTCIGFAVRYAHVRCRSRRRQDSRLAFSPQISPCLFSVCNFPTRVKFFLQIVNWLLYNFTANNNNNRLEGKEDRARPTANLLSQDTQPLALHSPIATDSNRERVSCRFY